MSILIRNMANNKKRNFIEENSAISTSHYFPRVFKILKYKIEIQNLTNSIYGSLQNNPQS